MLRLTRGVARGNSTFSWLQGDWNANEGKCHTVIHLETQFSKKTMWRKAIEAGSKSANVAGMKDLMHMVRSLAVPPTGELRLDKFFVDVDGQTAAFAAGTVIICSRRIDALRA